MARRSRQISSSVASIGEIPAVKDVERRRRCERDLLAFLVTYFPNSTGKKPFSDDHRRIIGRMERACMHGGRIVNAVYRGFAKTTISERTAIWATINGHRKFVPVFGSEAEAAKEIIDSIKRELMENDLLAEDYPEAITSIRALEGKPQRCKSQHYRGRLTHVEWTVDTVVLPTIKLDAEYAASLGIPLRTDGYTVSSGAILRAKGLTAASRGMKKTGPDGSQQRPDFAIVDDPQTDASANTDLQVDKRINVIKKSILRSSGHESSIAVVVNATVIRENDLVEQFLDPKKNPSFQGERVPLVKQMPTALDTLWLTKYAEIRNGYDQLVVGDQERAQRSATEFYEANRAAMDAGCVVSWPDMPIAPGEVSAVQHALNILIDDGPDVFDSECQQRPAKKLDADGEVELMPRDEIIRRINGMPRGVVPAWATKLTAFVDIQGNVLVWMAMAFADDFTCSVLDYGYWPQQNDRVFERKKARHTLQALLPGSGDEACLHHGLSQCVPFLIDRDWQRDDGASLRIEKLLIDCGGSARETVLNFVRSSPHRSLLLPSQGYGTTTSKRPISEWTRKTGETHGHAWVIKSDKQIKIITVGTNEWKMFGERRLNTHIGESGSMTLYGDEALLRREPGHHRALAAQWRAEYCVRTTANGRTNDEFRPRPSKPDNDFFDCRTGCLAAASVLGCSLRQGGVIVKDANERRRIPLPSDRRTTRRVI